MKRILIFLFLLAFVGCATKHREIVSYNGDIKGLAGTAQFKFIGKGWSRIYDAALVVSPPSGLRINFLGPTGDVVFDVGSSGKKNWGLRKLRSLGVRLAPEELVKLLLGEGLDDLQVRFEEFKKIKKGELPHRIIFETKDGDRLIVQYKDIEIIFDD